MDSVQALVALLTYVIREGWYEMERESREFLDPLHDWVNNLLQRTLPADWRDQLHAYLAYWEAEGYRLPPASVQTLELWIERWARYRGLDADCRAFGRLCRQCAGN